MKFLSLALIPLLLIAARADEWESEIEDEIDMKGYASGDDMTVTAGNISATFLGRSGTWGGITGHRILGDPQSTLIYESEGQGLRDARLSPPPSISPLPSPFAFQSLSSLPGRFRIQNDENVNQTLTIAIQGFYETAPDGRKIKNR
jgi:hypothetical protein